MFAYFLLFLIYNKFQNNLPDYNILRKEKRNLEMIVVLYLDGNQHFESSLQEWPLIILKTENRIKKVFAQERIRKVYDKRNKV